MKDLTRLFYPKSIAVIGASEHILKWGSIIITNIMAGGFEGEVYPVTTSSESVYGKKAYKAIGDIGKPVDLVVVTIPAHSVQNVIEQCAFAGVKNVVIVSSGFSETNEEGKELEKRLSEFARSKGINIVGPNTMGMANFKINLHAMFSHVRLLPGGISLMAQSGNVGNQIMYWAEQQQIGLSKFVGSGNEAVLRCEDYLNYFSEDKDTSVIIMYIEGVDDGRLFMDAARKTTVNKPIVLLKGGRTAVGSKAAMSHTGALAGSIQIFRAAMEQCGVCMVDSQSEMLTLAAAFDSLPLPKGNRVGVVTLGGGWGVITADECEEHGLVLPPLSKEVMEKLDERLPHFWSKGNPVDLVGQPDPQLYKESVEIMAASELYDAIIVLGIINSFKSVLKLYDAAIKLGKELKMDFSEMDKHLDEMQNAFLDNIAELMEKYNKPIYPVALVSPPDQPVIHRSKRLGKYHAMIFKTPEEAVKCLARQYWYAKYLKKVGRL